MNGLIAFPDFSDADLGEKPTDFNDLHRLAGLREVQMQVYEAFPVVGVPVGTFQARYIVKGRARPGTPSR